MTAEEIKAKEKVLKQKIKTETKNKSKVTETISSKLDEFKRTQLAGLYQKSEEHQGNIDSFKSDIEKMRYDYVESKYRGASVCIGIDPDVVRKAIKENKVRVRLDDGINFCKHFNDYAFVGKIYNHPSFISKYPGFEFQLNMSHIPVKIKKDGTLEIIHSVVYGNINYTSKVRDILDIDCHLHPASSFIYHDGVLVEDALFEILYIHLLRYTVSHYQIDASKLEDGTRVMHCALGLSYKLVKTGGIPYSECIKCNTKYPFAEQAISPEPGTTIIKGFRVLTPWE